MPMPRWLAGAALRWLIVARRYKWKNPLWKFR
jgi:hypothetical protein